MILKIFSDQELAKAYSFFSGLSWGRRGNIQLDPVAIKEERIEALNLLKKHANAKRIYEYIDRPTTFDKDFDVRDKLKMRILARYLVGKVF